MTKPNFHHRSHRCFAPIAFAALIAGNDLSLAQPVVRQTVAARAPSEIVAASPGEDWAAIAVADLLIMDLEPAVTGQGRPQPRRVVIQLMPTPFAQGWIGNIRKLAAAHWWDGTSINRVQDNYVVQWGDADGEDKARAKALPAGLAKVPESDYVSVFRFVGTEPVVKGGQARPRRLPEVIMPLRLDSYGTATFTTSGWPVGVTNRDVWPVHCYGAVGVGRNLSPDTGSGAELYAVIGHAPRHLDRNIAVVGRVIEGIEHLSSLPRGTGALGFYEKPAERLRIVALRPGTEVPGLPAYEYLAPATQSFANYAEARSNRRDEFFIRPAGGADVCNIPVPVRRVSR